MTHRTQPEVLKKHRSALLRYLRNGLWKCKSG